MCYSYTVLVLVGYFLFILMIKKDGITKGLEMIPKFYLLVIFEASKD